MYGAGKIKFVEIQSTKVKKIEQQTNPIALAWKMIVCLLIPRGEEQIGENNIMQQVGSSCNEQ